MKRIVMCAVALAAALALTVPALAEGRKAGREKRQKDYSARQEARKVTTSNLAVEGEELKANIEKLDSELAWHDDVKAALKAAEKADKPVFVLNVLGDRCGYV